MNEGSKEAASASQLENLQADVMAKQGTRNSAPATKPGAFAEGGGGTLTQLERDIAAKSSGPAPRAMLGQGQQLEELEEACVVAKRQRRPAAPATTPGVSYEPPRNLDSGAYPVLSEGGSPYSNRKENSVLV